MYWIKEVNNEVNVFFFYHICFLNEIFYCINLLTTATKQCRSEITNTYSKPFKNCHRPKTSDKSYIKACPKSLNGLVFVSAIWISYLITAYYINIQPNLLCFAVCIILNWLEFGTHSNTSLKLASCEAKRNLILVQY